MGFHLKWPLTFTRMETIWFITLNTGYLYILSMGTVGNSLLEISCKQLSVNNTHTNRTYTRIYMASQMHSFLFALKPERSDHPSMSKIGKISIGSLVRK